MNTAPTAVSAPLPNQVLALVDDPRAARVALAISSALAQLTQRDLQVVYVENIAALAAAALPATQVLAAALARWAPLGAPDIERAWRIEADRLRRLANQASLARTVRWSMRVVRGTLPDAAQTLMAQSDLLLVAGTASQFGVASVGAPCRTVVALDDGSAAGAQALQVATRLAQTLGARLQRHGVAIGAPWTDTPADLLVLPQTLLPSVTGRALARLPTLLVGATV